MRIRLSPFLSFRFCFLPLLLGSLRADAPAAPLSSPAAQLKMFLKFTSAKNTVSAVTASATSPMPPAFESVIPEKDFFDLLAYLLTPPKS